MEPLFLLGPEDRPRGARAIGAAVRDLVAAVLAGVQHAELRQAAEGEAPVELRVRPGRHRGQPQGQVLVERPVGVRAPDEELLGRGRRAAARRDVRRVVVVHLVVVPGHHPREVRMRGLEVPVDPVLGVPDPVLVERHRGTGVLVDVVPEVHDEVELLLGHVAIRGVVPAVEGLTGREREAHRADGGAGRRRGPRPSHRADLPARLEAIEVPASRPQARDLDVDRVRQLRPRDGHAPPDDPPEALVVGDLPAHRDLRVGHPALAAVGERSRGEARPQDHPVREGIARRHPQPEREVGEGRLRTRLLGVRARAEDQRRRAHAAVGQELPAVHAHARIDTRGDPRMCCHRGKPPVQIVPRAAT